MPDQALPLNLLKLPIFSPKGDIYSWERSRLVGERISELRKSFMTLSDEQRAELARQVEVELKAGLKIMGKDKKTIKELLALVDPPAIK